MFILLAVAAGALLSLALAAVLALDPAAVAFFSLAAYLTERRTRPPRSQLGRQGRRRRQEEEDPAPLRRC